ncbi:MAG TPA: peptide-methionine (S)-S-oxide reductase MsrA [Acetobacteraceae bacterium]|nr:peptide-methionine (S)-S-oxide reductase MsrA [Acetobacteraceae bacterium]
MATEQATLGGGCFWCLEPVFMALRGVQRSVSGYAGGHVPNPTYEMVCSKRTGHAEVVQLTFDPAEISYADILRVFFTMHDPTTLNRQGADVGTQYRSVILTHSEQQAETARKVKAEIEAEKVWQDPIVTEIVPLEAFYPAEPEHQDYFNRNPWSGYCQHVIPPKVAKLRKLYRDRLKVQEAA